MRVASYICAPEPHELQASVATAHVLRVAWPTGGLLEHPVRLRSFFVFVLFFVFVERTMVSDGSRGDHHFWGVP